MMRSFQRMYEAWINRFNRNEARALTPHKGLPCTSVSTGSIHRELEKVKFLKFFGASDGTTAEAWLENMVMCFSLSEYTSNMKVHLIVFQLKGSIHLWWNLLAIVYALRVWRHYLIGKKFELKMDHCGLQHIFTQSDLNVRQRHWLKLLSEYNFEITYIK
jgi:hypothetical protein